MLILLICLSGSSLPQALNHHLSGSDLQADLKQMAASGCFEFQGKYLSLAQVGTFYL